MGSQLFEVLRQGIWASITGGWYHDSRQPLFTNTFHLYLWLLFLSLPLTIAIYFESTIVMWSCYCGIIGSLFLTIKILNYRFHYLFDTTEPILDPPKEKDPSSPSDSEPNSDTKAKTSARPNILGIPQPLEGIELQILQPRSGASTTTRPREDQESPIGGDLKVDVHRKESSSSSSSSEEKKEDEEKCGAEASLSSPISQQPSVFSMDLSQQIHYVQEEKEDDDEPQLGPHREEVLSLESGLPSAGATALDPETEGEFGGRAFRRTQSSVGAEGGGGGEWGSESEEEVRAATPLLARHASLEQKAKGKESLGGSAKRVSFSTRSLDGAPRGSFKPPHHGPKQLDGDLSNLEESSQRRFVLLPNNESMTGWGQAGGPFPSQWLFQAVNVAVKAITSLNGNNNNSNSPPKIEEVETGDNDSLKSEDSQNHSLVGLNLLFESDIENHPPSGAQQQQQLDLYRTREEREREREREKCPLGVDLHRTLKNDQCYGSTPKKQRRTATHPAHGLSARLPRQTQSPPFDEERRRSLRSLNDQEPSTSSNRSSDRRGRESSPRVLERLLEESQEASPSTGRSDSLTTRRRVSGTSSPSQSNMPNAFLQSAARELRTHLRSLGNQNSLDIAGGSPRGGIQGVFRNREDSLYDIDSNPSSVNRHRRLRRLASSRRSLERRRDTQFTSSPLGSGMHMANSHDDTTEGAVHYFQDERGQWHSYTFAEELEDGMQMQLQATAAALPPIKTPSSSESLSSSSADRKDVALSERSDGVGRSTSFRRPPPGLAQLRPSMSGGSRSGGGSPIPSLPSLVTITPELSSTSGLGGRLPLPNYSSMQRSWQRNRRDVIQVLTDSLLERRRVPYPDHTHQSQAQASERNSIASAKQPRAFYPMKILPCFSPKYAIKVWFDRLKLVALLDRNPSIWESLFAITLAVMVSVLGSWLLHRGFYRDLSQVLLCFVIASCQFSLVKSVQPDAASPTHGFNRIVAFSRPIYFLLCAGAVWILQRELDFPTGEVGPLLYSFHLWNPIVVGIMRDGLLYFILAFPLLFSLGLFPQFSTFLLYVLEQIDVHMFGGNAAASLLAVASSLLRSFVAIGIFYGLAYGALAEPQGAQHVLFSLLAGLLVSISYHLSRIASDPSVFWAVLKTHLCPDEDCFGDPPSTKAEDEADPLPKKLRETVNARLKSDLVLCSTSFVLAFAVHVSTVLTALEPSLTLVLCSVAIALGCAIHYIIPQLRKQLPCLLVAHPILQPAEYNAFEVSSPAKLMWFERCYVALSFLERNVMYPLLFLSALTEDAGPITNKFGLPFGSLILVVAAMKAFRKSFSDPSYNYLIVGFTLLFFEFDWAGHSETFLVDFFFMSILFGRVHELWLKMQFVLTYVAPWQITWGSAFHAFAQPFSVPHSAMLFVQALVSSILSAPLNPFLGSAIFLTSYVRPLKFWERDYKTRRVDHSNTRLAAHIDRNPGADDNNLNSIFYEHLTRSLQHSLSGDIYLGRWGGVCQGDCFVLASDYLNCLVHIVEVGNGLVSFQVRGLEFRGTYCQQREVEAISEGVEDDEGCCCCEPGHLPHLLSANAAFSQRWLAWELTLTKYVLEGYSISDNSAVSMLQVFDLRKILITYYVKSIIYYAIKAEKLEEWLKLPEITTALRPTLEPNYADLDPVFSVNIDEDYEFSTSGITRNSFCNVYLPWIQFCIQKRQSEGEAIESSRDSTLVSLCFALGILGRRALGVAAHSNSLSSVEFFLYGLHALFKGDFRITSQRDEWVFSDIDLLNKVVSPAVRMSLKLHQDHFMCPDEYDDHLALYEAISYNEAHLVISHEGDPSWRTAVLAGTPALLALRHVVDDGTDEYKIIMLNKRQLAFRVIKLNRECVRGLWAGQQQELVYLRNRDPERGSIQNAKQALRNIINSSCDQPIGYPIYVSPLTTSYADTHVQLTSLLGGPVSLSGIKEWILELWVRIRRRCVQGCSSGSAAPHEETPYGQEGLYAMTNPSLLPTDSIAAVVSSGVNVSGSQSLDGSVIGGSSVGRGSLSRGNFNRGSVASNVSGSFGKPSTSTLASLAGFLTDTNGSNREKEAKSTSLQRARIIDANQVYDGLNLGRRIDVVWPDETMRARGGRSYWQNWVPEDGMEGIVVHKWIPSHRDAKSRSITDKTILLLKIEDKFVPIAEGGVADLGAEL